MYRIRRLYTSIPKRDEFQEGLFVLTAHIVLPDLLIPFLVQQENIKISLVSRLVYHVRLATFALKVHQTMQLEHMIVQLGTTVFQTPNTQHNIHVLSELTTITLSVIV